MSESLWINAVGGLIVLMAAVETFTGVAWETGGLVRRAQRPGVFWFSVVCKLVVGIAVLNVEHLRAVFGA